MAAETDAKVTAKVAKGVSPPPPWRGRGRPFWFPRGNFRAPFCRPKGTTRVTVGGQKGHERDGTAPLRARKVMGKGCEREGGGDFWGYFRAPFGPLFGDLFREEKSIAAASTGPAGLQGRACATLRPGGRRMGPCWSFRVGNGCRAAAWWAVAGEGRRARRRWAGGERVGRTAVRVRRPAPAVAAAALHGPRWGGERAARERRNLPLNGLPEKTRRRQ